MRRKLDLLKIFSKNSFFKPGTIVSEHFEKIEQLIEELKRNEVFDLIPVMLFTLSENYLNLVEKLATRTDLTKDIIYRELVKEESFLLEKDLKDEFNNEIHLSEVYIKKELFDPLLECEESFEGNSNAADSDKLNKNINRNEEKISNTDSDNYSDNVIDDDSSDSDFNVKKCRPRMRGPKKNRNRRSRDSKGELKCKECDNVYLLRKNLEKHLLRDHKKSLAEISKYTADNFGFKSSSYCCPICFSTFTRKKMYEAHVKIHGKDGSLKVRCGICKFWAKDNIEIQTHYNEKHPEKLACKICDKTFVNALGVHLHVNNFHRKYKMTEEFQEKIDVLKSKTYNNEPLKKLHVGNFICTECSVPKVIKQRTKFEQHLFKMHKKTLEEITTILKIMFNVEASKFMCKYCGMAYKTEKILDIHVKSHGEDGNLKFGCRFCTIFFGSTKEELMDHYNSIHPTSLKCLLCNITFEKVAKVFEHKRKHHPRTFRCKREANLVNNQIQLGNKDYNDEEIPFSNLKKDKLQFQCIEHDKTYVQVHIYQKHLITEHAQTFDEVNVFLKERFEIDSKLACKICYKRYQTYTSLIIHEKLHGEESNLTKRCLHCPKLFASKADLIAHCEQHHKDKSFCTKCKKIVISNIKDHNRVVHGPKKVSKIQYFCGKCGREFDNKNYLTNHEASDCGKNPMHECDVCNKRFMYAGTLVKHKLVHTSVFPFECSYCHKGFRQKTAKVSHERTHTGEKPFKCKLCEFATNHSYNLKNHMSIHTGIKRYTCSVCGDSFSCFSGLKSHYNSRLDTCGADPNRILRVNPNTFIGYRNGEICFDKTAKRKSYKKE